MLKRKRRFGPRPMFKHPVTLGVRVEKSEYDQLVTLATAERINVSSVVRRAVARYLEYEAPRLGRVKAGGRRA